MGIRFYCPNGHKLNVKEFQAGQRGICPRCHAKFDIPFESTRPAGSKDLPIAKEWEMRARREGLFPFTKKEEVVLEDINLNALPMDMNTVPGLEASTAGMSSILEVANEESRSAKQPTTAQPTARREVHLPDPFTGSNDLVWYVRPSSGEQLGPVDQDVMRSWLQANRIAVDALVWKEGWADWKVASEVFESLASQKNAFGF